METTLVMIRRKAVTKSAMRTGLTPDQYQLRDEFMPYRIYSQMTDEELEAL